MPQEIPQAEFQEYLYSQDPLYTVRYSDDEVPAVDYPGKLARFLHHSRISSMFDAEDVTQEAFIKMQRNAVNCPGKIVRHPRNFMGAVVRNTHFDLLRKYGCEKGLIHQSHVELRDQSSLEFASPNRGRSHSPTPLEHVMVRELKTVVEKEVESLPALQAEAFTLHVLEGKKYEEIAKSTEVEIGTVILRVYYARRKLEEPLKKI